MITENLSTLKIHKLTQEQYDRELDAGRIDENALYLTPADDVDLSGYATIDYVDNEKYCRNLWRLTNRTVNSAYCYEHGCDLDKSSRNNWRNIIN